MDCSMPGFPVLSPAPKACLNSCPSSQWCHPSYPLLSTSPPAFSLSHHQSIFQGDSSSHQVTWALEFQLRHLSFQWIFRTHFLRIDLFDLLVVQGTLKSLLQHHSSKASILWLSSFFMVQLSHPYMTTGKTIALTRWTFVSKVMSLLFNMLSRLVIDFLPSSKSFNFMATVTICSDFGAQESKVSHCFPIYLPCGDGTRCHDLCFLNVEF